MEKKKRIVVEFCRIVVGGLFVFSGFVKAVDPLGWTYKFNDYLTAFSLSWLEIISLPASFFLSAFEFALGICLLLGVLRRFTSLLTLLFMCFMTPLTLYLAIANPVTDCGCFGDAWIISNWETFSKNVVLLAMSVIIFIWSKKMTLIFSYKMNWLVLLFTYIFSFSLSFYCYQNLPILDFRPYKIGANIPDGMVVPEGMPADQNITTFIYEKDGVQKEFSLDEAPMNDSTWTFIDAKNELIKGYQPAIHDFTITTSEGMDITEDVLEDAGYTFLLISSKLEKAEESNVDRINEIYDYAQLQGYQFYCITGSDPMAIAEWIGNTGADYPICTMDEITLKTIIRSNPGLVLIKDGTIYNKWHNNNIPENEILESPLEESSFGSIASNNDKKKMTAVCLLFLIPIVLLYAADTKSRQQKKASQKS